MKLLTREERRRAKLQVELEYLNYLNRFYTGKNLYTIKATILLYSENDHERIRKNAPLNDSNTHIEEKQYTWLNYLLTLKPCLPEMTHTLLKVMSAQIVNNLSNTDEISLLTQSFKAEITDPSNEPIMITITTDKQTRILHTKSNSNQYNLIEYYQPISNLIGDLTDELLSKYMKEHLLKLHDKTHS